MMTKPQNSATTASPGNGESSTAEPGVFNFRSLLRKTNIDHESPKPKSPEAAEPGQVDYRSVLKKKAADKEEFRLKRHIYAT